MKISVALLNRFGACNQQVDLFSDLFGPDTEITVAKAVEHADQFDWSWAAVFLTNAGREQFEKAGDVGREQYEEVIGVARAKHDERIKPSRDKYNQIFSDAQDAFNAATGPADAAVEASTLDVRYGRYNNETERQALYATRDAARAEYNRVLDIARREFNRVAEPAQAEYNKTMEPSWQEYDKIRDAAWSEYNKTRAEAWATAALEHGLRRSPGSSFSQSTY